MAVAWTCDRGGCGQVIRGIADLAELELRAVYDDLHRRMHEGRQLPLFVEVLA